MFEKKYYYGDQKIKASKKVCRDVGIIKDVEYLEIELQNGSIELVLARNAKNVILSKRGDATKLRADRCKKAIEEVAQVFFEFNIRWNEYPFVIQSLNKALEDSERMAATNLWGKGESEITFLNIFDKMDAQRKLERGELKLQGTASSGGGEKINKDEPPQEEKPVEKPMEWYPKVEPPQEKTLEKTPEKKPETPPSATTPRHQN